MHECWQSLSLSLHRSLGPKAWLGPAQLDTDLSVITKLRHFIAAVSLRIRLATEQTASCGILESWNLATSTRLWPQESQT